MQANKKGITSQPAFCLSYLCRQPWQVPTDAEERKKPKLSVPANIDVHNPIGHGWVSPSTYSSRNMCSPSNTAYVNCDIQSPSIIIRAFLVSCKSSSMWRWP